MGKVSLKFNGKEIEAIITILKDGEIGSITNAIQVGLTRLLRKDILAEMDSSLTSLFISEENRNRILNGESLASISDEIKKKTSSEKNPKVVFKDAGVDEKEVKKDEGSASKNVVVEDASNLEERVDKKLEDIASPSDVIEKQTAPIKSDFDVNSFDMDLDEYKIK